MSVDKISEVIHPLDPTNKIASKNDDLTTALKPPSPNTKKTYLRVSSVIGLGCSHGKYAYFIGGNLFTPKAESFVGICLHRMPSLYENVFL